MKTTDVDPTMSIVIAVAVFLLVVRHCRGHVQLYVTFIERPIIPCTQFFIMIDVQGRRYDPIGPMVCLPTVLSL